jgi:hypothetical protein
VEKARTGLRRICPERRDTRGRRTRAEPRCGQLLSEREMANGARGTGSNQHRVVGSQPASPPPLAGLGSSHTQSSRWCDHEKLRELSDVVKVL